ncbi:hypothetical protein BJX64DRAFT_248804 [Aspergillus heterothallicus]
MEVRSLARSLRMRPATTSLFYTRQYQRNLLRNQFLRFNSRSSSSPSHTPAPTDLPTSSERAAPPEQRGSEKTAAPTDSPYTFKSSKTAHASQPESNEDTIDSIGGILNKLQLHSPRQPPATTNQMKTDLKAQRAGRQSYEVKERFKVDLKLGPSLGRTVNVEPGNGVRLADALRIMHKRLVVNHVKSDAMSQRFHMRKGMLKKTLRRRRWRKLFKFSFKHTLAKVERMRNQGW